MKKNLVKKSFNFFQQRLYSAGEKQKLFENGENLFFINNSLTYAFDGQFFPPKTASNKNHVVLMPMWLDKVHQDNVNLKWGQLLLDFPAYPRNLFRNLFPLHNEGDRISFGQMIEMRNYQCDFLKQQHNDNRIILHDLRHLDIKEYESAQLLHFKKSPSHYNLSVDKKQLLTLSKRKLGLVFNYLSLPNELPDDLVELGFNKSKPHTELYYMPRHKVPDNILISGTGLSAVWIKRDFSRSNLFIITDSRDAKLPQIPSNKDVPYELINRIYYEDLMIDKQHKVVKVIDAFDSEYLIDYKKDYFTAIGYRPYNKLTNIIPRSNLITLMDGHNDRFISPQNVPKGSLTHRLAMFYYRSEIYTDLESCFEMQFYFDRVLPTTIDNRMKKAGIKLELNFFDVLEESIKKSHNALPRNRELDMYVNIFTKTQPNITNKKTAVFKGVIENLQYECENRFKNTQEVNERVDEVRFNKNS